MQLKSNTGVKAPKSARGICWWKIAVATVNEGLRAGVFDLSTDTQPDERWHYWCLRGIPVGTRFTTLAQGAEIMFTTHLWWQPVDGWSWRSEVRALGWLERERGRWLQNSPSKLKGRTRARKKELDALEFERPLGYEALGKLVP